jgi:hypothetical protein
MLAAAAVSMTSPPRTGAAVASCAVAGPSSAVAGTWSGVLSALRPPEVRGGEELLRDACLRDGGSLSLLALLLRRLATHLPQRGSACPSGCRCAAHARNAPLLPAPPAIYGPAKDGGEAERSLALLVDWNLFLRSLPETDRCGAEGEAGADAGAAEPKRWLLLREALAIISRSTAPINFVDGPRRVTLPRSLAALAAAQLGAELYRLARGGLQGRGAESERTAPIPAGGGGGSVATSAIWRSLSAAASAVVSAAASAFARAGDSSVSALGSRSAADTDSIIVGAPVPALPLSTGGRALSLIFAAYLSAAVSALLCLSKSGLALCRCGIPRVARRACSNDVIAPSSPPSVSAPRYPLDRN